MRTDPFSQLFGRKQAVRFNHGSFAMYPLRLNGIEPGALCRQAEGQDAHAFARLLDLLVVLSDPGAHDFADMPGCVIPDQQPGFFALSSQALAAPVKKLGGNVAHGASGNKAQPHLFAYRIVGCALLPQHPIAGQCFGIRVSFFLGLLHQAYWLFLILPGVHAREGKAAPPHFVEEANGPVGLLTGPGDQAVTSFFLTGIGGRVW